MKEIQFFNYLYLWALFLSCNLIAYFCVYFRFRKVSAKRLRIYANLLKFFLASLLFTGITLAISNLFKQKELELRELEYFDKYVDAVKQIDGLEPRLRLCRYFAIVAPEGEFRTAWSQYLKEVEHEKLLNDHEIAEAKKIKADPNKTPQKIQRLKELEYSIQLRDAPLGERPIENQSLVTPEMKLPTGLIITQFDSSKGVVPTVYFGSRGFNGGWNIQEVNRHATKPLLGRDFIAIQISNWKLEINAKIFDLSGRQVAEIKRNKWQMLARDGIKECSTSNAFELTDERGHILFQLVVREFDIKIEGILMNTNRTFTILSSQVPEVTSYPSQVNPGFDLTMVHYFDRPPTQKIFNENCEIIKR